MSKVDLSDIFRKIAEDVNLLLNDNQSIQDIENYVSNLLYVVLPDNFLIKTFLLPICDWMELSVYVYQLIPFKGIVANFDCKYIREDDVSDWMIDDIDFNRTTIRIDDKILNRHYN